MENDQKSTKFFMMPKLCLRSFPATIIIISIYMKCFVAETIRVSWYFIGNIGQPICDFLMSGCYICEFIRGVTFYVEKISKPDIIFIYASNLLLQKGFEVLAKLMKELVRFSGLCRRTNSYLLGLLLVHMAAQKRAYPDFLLNHNQTWLEYKRIGSFSRPLCVRASVRVVRVLCRLKIPNQK